MKKVKNEKEYIEKIVNVKTWNKTYQGNGERVKWLRERSYTSIQSIQGVGYTFKINNTKRQHLKRVTRKVLDTTKKMSKGKGRLLKFEPKLEEIVPFVPIQCPTQTIQIIDLMYIWTR